MQPIAIVDAYSSGRLLAPEFLKRGYPSVHIQSSQIIPAVYKASFIPNDFLSNLVFDGNYENLVRCLKDLRPLGVIPGAEPGVELADRLSEDLGVKSNGTKLSQARRDKFAMSLAVEAANVPTIPFFCATSVEDGMRRLNDDSRFRFPLVVKPIKSAGTDSVKVCDSPAEVREQLSRILGQRNRLDLVNEGALVQVFVEGDEYIVDTVSIHGSHKLCALWKYHKQRTDQGEVIYEASEVLPLDDSVSEVLTGYTMKILDALGIRFGPGHTELMLTKNGPLLIEIGARLDGSDAPIFGERAYGVSQVHLTADCYLDQTNYWKQLDKVKRLKSYQLLTYLVSKQSGVIRKIHQLDKIRALPSFKEMTLNIDVGRTLSKTVDLFTNPGRVNLAHQSKNQLWQDYDFIRQLEKTNSIFELA